MGAFDAHEQFGYGGESSWNHQLFLTPICHHVFLKSPVIFSGKSTMSSIAQRLQTGPLKIASKIQWILTDLQNLQRSFFSLRSSDFGRGFTTRPPTGSKYGMMRVCLSGKLPAASRDAMFEMMWNVVLVEPILRKCWDKNVVLFSGRSLLQ